MTQPTRTRTIDWHDPMQTAAGVHGKTVLLFLQAMVAGARLVRAELAPRQAAVRL